MASSFKSLGRNSCCHWLARWCLGIGDLARNAASIDCFRGARIFICRRQTFQVSSRVAHHDACAAHWRHDHRRIHTHRRRHCSLCLGHHSRIFLVSHAELQNVCEDLLGHRRDHCHRHVHCGGCQHFWLDAHGHRRHSGHQRLGAWFHARALEVFAAGQFTHVVCGLLLRAHCRHHHPRSHLGSHLPKAGYRLGPLRFDHGAQPHDWSVAPTHGHGAVCLGACGQTQR